VNDNRICPNSHVVPNSNATNYFRSGSNANSIADYRRQVAFMADRHLLVNPTIGTNPSCCDDGGKSMLEEHAWPDVASAYVKSRLGAAENFDQRGNAPEPVVKEAAKFSAEAHQPHPSKPKGARVVQAERVPPPKVGVNQTPIAADAPQDCRRNNPQGIEPENCDKNEKYGLRLH
jgi:hypothetical protein